MYEHPFTIKEVAWLLSIRCLDGGSDQEFPVECPYCGDTRGKCSFCISKNGEIKNVFHCFHCGQGGNMLTLYADIMGLYGEDRCKVAYQDIVNRLETGSQGAGNKPKKITSRYKGKPSVPKRSPEYVDFVYRQMIALMQLQDLHKADFKRRGATDFEIKELEKKGYKSVEPKNARLLAKKLEEKGIRLDGIPGFYRNRDGKWEASFYEGNKGYLCPVYSLNQKIKGFQIRVDHPVNKRKYIWFTSSGFEGGTSSGSPAGISGYISPVQKNIRVTEGILKAELASMRSGYPYIGIPGVGNYKSLQLVLMELKIRGLQTVYECMDMDKMMNLTCRCDCKEKCIWCEKPERLLKKQECSHKRRKRDTIRKGCLKLYEMCETMNLNCMRISWDTDEKGLWLGNYKGVDDWLYRKPPQEKERFS